MCNKFKVKDLQEFQGVSQGKLCHVTIFILTFSADSHYRLDIFVSWVKPSTVTTPILTCCGGCRRFR